MSTHDVDITVYPYHLVIERDGEHVGDYDYASMAIALGDDPSHGVVSLQQLMDAYYTLNPDVERPV